MAENRKANLLLRSMCLLGAGLFIQVSTQAREFYDIFPTPYGRSMGGAVTALVDDYNSLFYNPAGLALIETTSLRMPDLVGGYGSPSIRDVFAQISSLSGGSSGTSGITTALSSLDRVGASAGFELLGVGWYQPKMAIHLNLLSAGLSFRVRTPSLLFAKIQARMTADSGVSLGFARSFLQKRLRAGITIRPFHLRGGFDQSYEGLEILNLQNVSSILGVGWGFDFDLGLQSHVDAFSVLGFPVRVSGGAALQNVLENRFTQRLTAQVPYNPPGTERRLNMGVGATVLGIEKFKPSLGIEFRDILVDSESWLEHLSVGAEFRFKPKTWFESLIRAHFYKGQLGGGIGGKLWFGELEVGTYAVSLGRGLGVGVDRRLYGRLSAVF
jgi:hypothetical protein